MYIFFKNAKRYTDKGTKLPAEEYVLVRNFTSPGVVRSDSSYKVMERKCFQMQIVILLLYLAGVVVTMTALNKTSREELDLIMSTGAILILVELAIQFIHDIVSMVKPQKKEKQGD